jgi:HSP20 family protein
MNELVRWDPFKAALPFEGSLLDLVPTFFQPLRQAASWPRMDISETDGAYQLAVELPGVKKEAIQVSVHDNSVTISAEASEEKDGNGEAPGWLLRERTLGRFSRNIVLGEAVDEDSSEARYNDGVLYLTLRKKRSTQAKRLAIH